MANNNESAPSTPEQCFKELYSIIKTLRGPDGCPWDREQDPKSMREYLLEESYECIDAIEEDDPAAVMEELGDLYLLVTMITHMYEQSGLFTPRDVLETISAKLRRRHPHVFGDSKVSDSSEVLKQWENIKENVEGGRPKTSALDGIPRTLPPLERAVKLQHKASKIGFDWKETTDVESKVKEELDELAEARNGGSKEMIEHEFGDVLFSLINLSRFLKIDPAISLHKANRRFFQRFRTVEERMRELNKEMNGDNFDLMDSLWNQAKKNGTD